MHTESLHDIMGGITSDRSRRWLPHLLLGVLIGTTGGCHNLRSQLKALTGSDSTSAASAGAATSGSAAKPSGGGHSIMPRAYGSKGPVPILDQTFHLRPDPAERAAGPGPRVPRFDWSGHDARLGGGLSDSPRHQRGD
jgi:hypothetical protein